MGEEKIRCFVALELSKEAKDEMEKIQKQIEKSDLLEAKFTKRDLAHLTLKFLGEIEKEKIEEVKKKLQEIKFPAFEAELGEIGIFAKKFIKIIWVKLENCDKLQKEIDKALKELFEQEHRFMSHTTIARVKKVGDKRALLEYIKNIKTKKIKFKVEEFFLKKSTLKPEGPVYENLGEYELV